MSDFTNFQKDIRDWTGRPDFEDSVVTSFIRMSETTIKDSLRVREMVVIADAVVTTGVVALPVDWVEADMIRFTGGKPLEYLTYDKFYDGGRHSGSYTILGNQIEFGAPIDEVEGLAVTMAYYQHLPVFTDTATWMYSKYYNIYLQACNAAAALFSQEFERATSLNTFVSTLIEGANATYRRGKVSGSVLRVTPGRRLG